MEMVIVVFEFFSIKRNFWLIIKMEQLRWCWKLALEIFDREETGIVKM